MNIYKIIIFLIIISNFKLNAQDVFGFPPNNIPLVYQDLMVDSLTKNCCIYRQLDSLNEFLLKNGNGVNPYSKLTFYKLNEQQIDSVINKIEHKYLIVSLTFDSCPIRKLPISVREFNSLYEINFKNCDFISSLNGYNSVNSIFKISFSDCHIDKLPEGIESFKSMLRLMMEIPDNFESFNLENELSRFVKRNNIIDLWIKYKLLNKFPLAIFELTTLQNLVFFSQNISYYPPDFDKLNNLINVFITTEDDSTIKSIKRGNTINYTRSCDYSAYDEAKYKIMYETKQMRYHDNQNLNDNDWFFNIPANTAVLIIKKQFNQMYEIDKHQIRLEKNPNSLKLRISVNNLESNVPGEIILQDQHKNSILELNIGKSNIIDFSAINNGQGMYIMTIKIGDNIQRWQIVII